MNLINQSQAFENCRSNFQSRLRLKSVVFIILAWTIITLDYLGQGQSNVPSDKVFEDVIVKNRFFSGREAVPTITVKTTEAVKLSCVIYDNTYRPVGYKAETSPAKQFDVMLDNLPD